MSRASADVRVALIGYGLGGAAFHAPLIACTPGMRLATIVTRNRGASRPGGARASTSDHRRFGASDMGSARRTMMSSWSRPATIRTFRSQWPRWRRVCRSSSTSHLRVRAAQAREVIAEARRRNLMLTVYHNRRWDSEMLTVKRLLAEQAFGDVLRFESRLERWRPQPKGGWRERGEPELAGGLLYDLGTHLIDQALHLFGPVTHVYAELDRRRPGMRSGRRRVPRAHARVRRAFASQRDVAQRTAARAHARSRFARGIREGARRRAGGSAAFGRASGQVRAGARSRASTGDCWASAMRRCLCAASPARISISTRESSLR